MKRVIVIIILSLLSAVTLFAGIKYAFYYQDNKRSNFSKRSEIFIYPHSTVDEVMATIIDSCEVKRVRSLKRAFKDKEVETYMQPGHYVIEPDFCSVYVARMLNNAWQTPVKLVLEGNMRNKESIAKRINAQMMVDSMSVYNALKNNELLSKFEHDTSSFFSLIFPASYEIHWTASIEDILQKCKDANDAYWTTSRRNKAKELGLTPYEVSILASIVKGETNYEPEMPKIAGVYLNRLAIGMKLQADPTVAYCFDYSLNRVLYSHLNYDSPYNTYKYLGLPPGPIMVPTKACLEAVLNPDYGATSRGAKGYLFFCASPDFNGSHLFAHSYSDQLKNARAYQKALTLRNKQQQ